MNRGFSSHWRQGRCLDTFLGGVSQALPRKNEIYNQRVGHTVFCNRIVGRTTQRLADRIKQHVPTSIRKKSNTVREQPPRLCKNNNSKINCESAIGEHLLMNPECAKTYTDDNFRIIGQARSSFHLRILESVYIKTQNPVLCKHKDFIFSLGIFK